MSDRGICVLVLAAGQGKRLKSSLPKVLHSAAGWPLLGHVLATAGELEPARVVLVLGHGREAVAARLAEMLPAGLRSDQVTSVVQEPQLGTGHAVRVALPELPAAGTLVVLSGDVPLLTAASVRRLLTEHAASGASVSFLTARLADAGAYGRVLRGSDGGVLGIVEARDASAAELAIDEVNTGIYALELAGLADKLAKLSRANAQGEEYLTDVVGAAVARGERVVGVSLADAAEMLGVNSRSDLAAVERALFEREARRLMEAGVTLMDPATTYVESGVEVGADSVLYPGTWLRRGTRVGVGSAIGPWTTIAASQIDDGAVVKMGCLVEGSHVGAGAAVGPFAHLRPGTELGEGAKVGNFVETKKARLGRGTKASHLSYLGDATIGDGVNIGAGTITCNYDGERKHETVIEDGVFIGSDSQLVAPVTVGRGAYVGAGSTVTQDVPAGALAVARSRQVNYEGWAEKKKARRARAAKPTGKE